MGLGPSPYSGLASLGQSYSEGLQQGQRLSGFELQRQQGLILARQEIEQRLILAGMGMDMVDLLPSPPGSKPETFIQRLQRETDEWLKSVNI